MKKYFSILYCLAALAAGCDDNNKEALAFDLSTDEWSFAKEGGTQNLIVLAPGVWKVSEKPDWCTLIPEGAERSREVKINCSANTGKKREGTLVLTCGDETRTIAVFQQGAYIVKGFPVEWLFTADYYATGKYTNAFVFDNDQLCPRCREYAYHPKSCRHNRPPLSLRFSDGRLLAFPDSGQGDAACRYSDAHQVHHPFSGWSSPLLVA